MLLHSLTLGWCVGGHRETGFIPLASQGLGFRNNIRAILDMWNDLEAEGYKFLLAARLNQDPIECLFSMIRARGGFDRNPTTRQLIRFLVAIIAMQFIRLSKSSNTNCRQDNDVNLLAIIPSSEDTVIIPDNGEKFLETECPIEIIFNQRFNLTFNF